MRNARSRCIAIRLVKAKLLRIDTAMLFLIIAYILLGLFCLAPSRESPEKKIVFFFVFPAHAVIAGWCEALANDKDDSKGGCLFWIIMLALCGWYCYDTDPNGSTMLIAFAVLFAIMGAFCK